MKKLWQKFKHWLIKKLGGYVALPPKVVKVDTYEVTPITTAAQININGEAVRHLNGTVGRQRFCEDVEYQIGILLGNELRKQGLVQYEFCENQQELRCVIRGVVQAIPPKSKKGTDLFIVLNNHYTTRQRKEEF